MKSHVMGEIITDYYRTLRFLNGLHASMEEENEEQVRYHKRAGIDYYERLALKVNDFEHVYDSNRPVLREECYKRLHSRKDDIITEIKIYYASFIKKKLDVIDLFQAPLIDNIKAEFTYLGSPEIQNVFDLSVNRVSGETLIKDSYQLINKVEDREKFQEIIGDTII